MNETRILKSAFWITAISILLILGPFTKEAKKAGYWLLALVDSNVGKQCRIDLPVVIESEKKNRDNKFSLHFFKTIEEARKKAESKLKWGSNQL